MAEDDPTVHSPTRVRLPKAKITSKSSKWSDDYSSRGPQRTQKNSQALSKSVGKNQLPHALSQPESMIPTRLTLPEGPRRTKSTPIQSSASSSLSQHFPPPSKHASIPAHPGPGPAPSPPPPPPSALSSSITKPSDFSPSLAPKNVSHLAPNPLPVVQTRRPVLVTHASVPALSQHLDPAHQKMLDRARKARLYFLRQSGPNQFLIGGDSMESRFYVNIGPQSCSCKRVHCVHLLFVMLRVLKVKYSSPMLWSKQLRNYEAESLLKDFHARVSQRSATPRKPTQKKFDFMRHSPDLHSDTSPGSEGGVVTKSSSVEPEDVSSASPDFADSAQNGTPPNRLSLMMGGTLVEEGGEEREGGEGSDKEEEDICPICLNELDEGEDLLICPGCTNHLHQHCMDIWAMEERNKNEQVHCPVCRALWPYPYPLTSPSNNYGPDVMPVTVPVEREGAGPGRSGWLKRVGSHPGLSQEKNKLLDELKEMFGCVGMDGLFSSEWKARETALSLISREAISHLLPQVKATPTSSSTTPTTTTISTTSTTIPVAMDGSECKDIHLVQKVCLEAVTHSINDSVLKVFLAALELLKVVLGYSVCSNQDDVEHLQGHIRPIVISLFTRCADAQRRVKDYSIEATCNLCLGQEGSLSVGSACGGHQNPSLDVTNLRYILQVALSGQDRSNTWHWWLGRLTFMDRLLNRFSFDFIISQCDLRPIPVIIASGGGGNSDSDFDDRSFGSGFVSPSDSLSSSVTLSVSNDQFHFNTTGSGPTSLELESFEQESDGTTSPGSTSSTHKSVIESNLLMQMWYFGAKASHIPHRKLGKVARRVIIWIAKILRDDPYSLEISHDVVARCHRTQAEGLMDRVLQARESPYYPSSSSSSYSPRHGNERGRGGGRVLEVERKRDGGGGGWRQRHHHASSQRDKKRFSSPRENSPRSRGHMTSSEGSGSVHAGAGGGGKEESRKKEEALASSHHSDSRKVRKQLSRGLSKSGNATSGEEFIASDDSFQSAVSELDLDCSSDTIRLPDSEEALMQVLGESSSASNSHDSVRSVESQKQFSLSTQSSSTSGSGKGEESGGGEGVVKGFPNKPGYSKFPHMYARQSTADSVSSDSLDLGWHNFCKKNIEEEEAEALAKVQSMIEKEVPHPPLSGLTPPTPEVLIHIQTTNKDGGGEHTDTGSGSRAYVEGEHWVKGKLIGTGAFCTCFLARDMENGTMFAVKQVSYARNTTSQEEDELSRLRDEVAMLGRINHPNIVRCLGATQHDGHINIFIEWMAGGCLDQLLHDFGRFGENVICNYARQVTRGIVFLHENGIIHRDLKGGNILVDSTGRRIRIADFGAAARLATHTTGSGEFRNMEGTVAFMAPEVVKGGTDDFVGYGRRCDVWSIGCVLIQMATAKPPWTGTYDTKNKFQLIFKIGQATSPPPMPEFSNPALKDFTIRCLEVKPEDRPTSLELLRHPLFTSA